MCVAIVGVAATVGTAAYGAYSSSQKAKSGAGGVSASAIKKYNPKTIPYQDVTQVDPMGAYKQSLQANKNLMPYDQALSSDVNAYNYGQASHYYNKIQPYFSSLQNQIGNNALSLSQGQLPADVQANIQRMAASQGISGGFGAGTQGNQNGLLANLNLRNLGLSSLNAMQQGDQLGMQANAQAKNLLPSMSSPTDFFVNPQTLLSGQEFNAGQLNSVLSQNYGYLNQAGAANAGAANAASQYNSQASNAANLASASIQQQGTSQIAGILGKYLSNQSGGGGGNSFSGTQDFGTATAGQTAAGGQLLDASAYNIPQGLA